MSRTIISTGEDSVVRIWDSKTGKLLHFLRQQTVHIFSLVPWISLPILKLLYSDNLFFSIDNLSTALDLLLIVLELLFEDCVKACIRFIEAVPWSEDDEKWILSLIPLMSEE
ncbi:hypothetical protein ACS0TY_013825 [Phlomoides rotata]